MKNEKNHLVASAFNSNRTYFEMMRNWHLTHNGLAVEPEVKAIIEKRCIPGSLIMEAGCGDGSITNWFAKRHGETSFSGIDISGIGIGMARESGLSNTDFRVADMKNIPFDDNAFDFVFSQSVLEHVVGWEQAIREIYRIIRKDGEFLIRVGNGGVHGKRIANAFFDYLFRRNKTLHRNPSFVLSPDNFEEHMTNFDVQEIPSDILFNELKKAGFKISSFSTRIHTFRNAPLNWKLPFLWGISFLNFWPFSHLGSVTIVLAKK